MQPNNKDIYEWHLKNIWYTMIILSILSEESF